MGNFKYAQYDSKGDGIDSSGRYPLVQILASSASPKTITGSTSDQLFGSVIIPGGVLGPNGFLRLTHFLSCNGTANYKTFKVKFGGVQVCIVDNAAQAATVGIQPQFTIRNRNSQTAQISNAPYSSSIATANGIPFTTSNIDTTKDQLLEFYGNLANASDTFTLETYLVELIAN